jgi:hypothetical protein
MDSNPDDNETDGDSDAGSVWGNEDDDLDMNESSRNFFSVPDDELRSHYERLVDWQVDLFTQVLLQIVAGRDLSKLDSQKILDPYSVVKKDGPVFEEVLECIDLPKFDSKAAKARVEKPGAVKLPEKVKVELRKFIRSVAARYRQNPFHSYAHASHVVQSANKLLARIVKPDVVNYRRRSLNAIASDLHDYTYGITSDPLSTYLTQLCNWLFAIDFTLGRSTHISALLEKLALSFPRLLFRLESLPIIAHFAVLFATLIHDVDHTGVSNAQRSLEEPVMAVKYKNKSVAEQNSVDLAWEELSRSDYTNLRQCICATEVELRRFRQLIVNLVMATDIFDKDMKELRNRRWDKAFHRDSSSGVREITPLSMEVDRNTRATIVIEHIVRHRVCVFLELNRFRAIF